MDCSTPGFPVLHHLLEFAQTHVHRVDDAIQPSHPLSSPSPPALNLSQHQGLFQCDSSLHQVAKILELQLQHQSFQWVFHCCFHLGLPGLISLLSVVGLSRVLSSTSLKASILWCSAFFFFFGAQPSSWSNSHMTFRNSQQVPFNHTWLYVNEVNFGKFVRVSGWFQGEPTT